MTLKGQGVQNFLFCLFWSVTQQMLEAVCTEMSVCCMNMENSKAPGVHAQGCMHEAEAPGVHAQGCMHAADSTLLS